MSATRILKHLFAPDWIVRRAFPRAVLRRIEAAIKESERAHRGELRFAVEAALDLLPLVRGVTPRRRALDLFARLNVWDTEENSGVLIYLQLVDRRIEIVADRGISAKVPQQEWDAICRRMEAAFRARRHEDGALDGIREITGLLARHFPARGADADELPDKPVVL
ncbi:MAG: TPM domain-containing protein [Betaproteobacteria bacterium]|nr:TPM domain-containing protein [Betaproteobacteria bacterium]